MYHWFPWVMPVVKNLPTKAEYIKDMDLEGPLEKEMATHSTILAWDIS